ncbi:hypothetical protein [Adhaeribacter radiodurans]|uniref:Uncharacterized protein n=1 Tax=Adhaeribacter radiodurans TaxID=2745197 RepID=A0A7L7LAR4_9BACT|nr:hypothetical protein [Adhaeribacter radiodurans]QMU29843.1 hypothetical protein HUW48_18245 [Adhaeribacter radiodurans]
MATALPFPGDKKEEKHNFSVSSAIYPTFFSGYSITSIYWFILLFLLESPEINFIYQAL